MQNSTRSQIQATAEILALSVGSQEILTRFLNDSEANEGFDSGEAITIMREVLARTRTTAAIAEEAQHQLCELVREVNASLQLCRDLAQECKTLTR